MTTSGRVRAVLLSLRRFVLGPWPLPIGGLWTFLSLMILGTAWRLFGGQPMIPQQDPLATRTVGILAVGLLGPGVVLVPLLVYRGIRRRLTQREVRWPEYLITLVTASAIGAALLNLILRDSQNFQDVLNRPGLIDTTVRILIPVWFINAVIGTVFARIRRESDTATQALQTVVAQRRLLLESEERVRSQVASFLHDRVQTDLVSIALRIRATIGQDPDVMTRELSDVISELERVRSQEVRRASRQLSPNLSTVSFDAALRDLAESYRHAMDVSVQASHAALDAISLRPDTSRATALYRICEQGLLNAAIHGHATECSIQVTLSPEYLLVLQLTDNGLGTHGQPLKPGMGMTVIAAWVEALDGQWSLAPASSGMTLTASFPST